MRTLRSLLVLLMLCAGGIACSSSDSPSACTPSFPTQTVELKDFAFEPTCIGVPRGTHLTLQNTGSTQHTFTIKGTSVDQKIDAGASGEVSFEGVAPGTYPVVCTLHPQMTATLQVT
jgi:plastocyanin